MLVYEHDLMTCFVDQDKTFGLKNKKGAKTQKFIQHVQKQIPKAEPKKELSKKEEKKKQLEELNALFKPVAAVQKVEAGVNPKSVLCAFFKAGTCGKGDKCKFSHDLSLARKSATKNIYEDDTKKEEGMEDWDDEKLKEVVEKKHGANEANKNPTSIICKYFLDAVENSKYGWFWECPNGNDKCIYRHVLPAGFVLKKDLKKEKKEEISIEDLVERERAKLGYNLPRIDLAAFMAWKKKKIEERRLKDKEELEKKKKDFTAGRNFGISGREMFTINPDLITEDQMDEDEATFDSKMRERYDEDDGVKIVELDLDKLSREARDADGSGTVVEARQFQIETSSGPGVPESLQVVNGATGPINEDLFDDDEDLSDLEEEVAALNVES